MAMRSGLCMLEHQHECRPSRHKGASSPSGRDMRKSITVWQVVDEWRDVYSLHPPSIFSTYLNCIGIRDNQFSPIARDL